MSEEHIDINPTSIGAATNGLSTGLSVRSYKLFITYVVVASFAITLDLILNNLEVYTKGTSYQVMVQRMYRTIMVMGLASYCIGMLQASNISFTLSWQYAYFFADQCSFMTAIFFCLHGVAIMIISISDANAWERAAKIMVEDLLRDVEYAQTQRVWGWIMLPFCRTRDQVEFRIIRSIFSSVYHISGDIKEFDFSLFLELTHESNLLELIDFNEWKWAVIMSITAMVCFKFEFGGNMGCTTVPCYAQVQSALFTCGGFFLLIVVCILRQIARQCELKLLRKFDIRDITDYEIYLMKENEIKEKLSIHVLNKKGLMTVISDLKHNQAVKLFNKQVDLKKDESTKSSPVRASMKIGSLFVKSAKVLVTAVDEVDTSADKGVLEDIDEVQNFDNVDLEEGKDVVESPPMISKGGSSRFAAATQKVIGERTAKKKAKKSIFNVLSDENARKILEAEMRRRKSSVGETAGSIQKFLARSFSRQSTGEVTPLDNLEELNEKLDTAMKRFDTLENDEPTTETRSNEENDLDMVPDLEEKIITDRRQRHQQRAINELKEKLSAQQSSDGKLTMFRDIFPYSKPEWFFAAIHLVMTGNSLYLAWWLTTFTFTATHTHAMILWLFIPLVPPVLVLVVLAQLLKSSTTLKAVTQVDLDSVAEVIKKTESINKYVNLLRKSLLHRLRLIGMENPRQAVSDLFEECDDSDSGTLSAEDFRRMLVRLQMFLDKSVYMGMFSRIDLNHDDTISLEVI
jgi:hypothetical protein